MIFTPFVLVSVVPAALLLHPRVLGFLVTFALRRVVRFAVNSASRLGYLERRRRPGSGGGGFNEAVRGGEVGGDVDGWRIRLVEDVRVEIGSVLLFPPLLVAVGGLKLRSKFELVATTRATATKEACGEAATGAETVITEVEVDLSVKDVKIAAASLASILCRRFLTVAARLLLLLGYGEGDSDHDGDGGADDGFGGRLWFHLGGRGRRHVANHVGIFVDGVNLAVRIRHVDSSPRSSNEGLGGGGDVAVVASTLTGAAVAAAAVDSGDGGTTATDPLLPVEAAAEKEAKEMTKKEKAEAKDDVASVLDLLRRVVHRVQVTDVSASVSVSCVSPPPSPPVAAFEEEKEAPPFATTTTTSRLEATFHLEQVDLSSAAVLRGKKKGGGHDLAASHAVSCGVDWLRLGLRATSTTSSSPSGGDGDVGGGGAGGGGEYWSRDAVRFVLPSASVGVGLPPPPPDPNAADVDASVTNEEEGEGGSGRRRRRLRRGRRTTATHVLRHLSISAGGGGGGTPSSHPTSAAVSSSSVNEEECWGKSDSLTDHGGGGGGAIRLDLGCRQLETLTRRVVPDATRLAAHLGEFARGGLRGVGGVVDQVGAGTVAGTATAGVTEIGGDGGDGGDSSRPGGPTTTTTTTSSSGAPPPPPRWRPPATFPLSASLSVGIAVRVHHGEGRGGGGDGDEVGGGGGGVDHDELRRIALRPRLRRRRPGSDRGGTLELRVAVEARLRHDVAWEASASEKTEGRGGGDVGALPSLCRRPVLLQAVSARVDAHASMGGPTAADDRRNADDDGGCSAREGEGESSSSSGDDILRLRNVGVWLQRSLLEDEEDEEEKHGRGAEESGRRRPWGDDDVVSGSGYCLDSLANNRSDGYIVAREDASVTVDLMRASVHPIAVGAVAELGRATSAHGPKRKKEKKRKGPRMEDPPVRTIDLLLRRTELQLLDGARLRPSAPPLGLGGGAVRPRSPPRPPAPFLALRAYGDGISASVEVNATSTDVDADAGPLPPPSSAAAAGGPPSDFDVGVDETMADSGSGGSGKSVAASISASSNFVVFAVSTSPPPIPIIPPSSTDVLLVEAPSSDRRSPTAVVTLIGSIGEISCTATATATTGGGCGGAAASGDKVNVQARVESVMAREHARDTDFAFLSSLAKGEEDRRRGRVPPPTSTATVVVAETRHLSIDACGSIARLAAPATGDGGVGGTGTGVGPPPLLASRGNDTATRVAEAEVGIVAAAPVALRWCSTFQWNVVAAARTAKRTAEYCKGLLQRGDDARVPAGATAVSSSQPENATKDKLPSVLRVRLEARDEVGVQIHAGKDSLINMSLHGLIVTAVDVSERRKPNVAVSGDRCVVHLNKHDPPIAMLEEFALEDEFRFATEGEVDSYESKRCPRRECPEDDGRGGGERGVVAAPPSDGDDVDVLVTDRSNRPLVECIDVRIKNIVSRVAPDLFFGQVLDDIVLAPKVLMEGLSRVGLFTRSRRGKRHQLMAISASIEHIDASILEDVSGEPPRTVASSNLYYDDRDRGGVRSSSSSAIHRMRVFVREVRANFSRKSPPSYTRRLLSRLDSDPGKDREYGKMDGGDDVWVCVDHAVVIVDPLTLAAPLAVVRNLRYEGVLMLAPLSPNTPGLAGGRLVHVPMSTFSSAPNSKEQQGDSSTTIRGVEIRSMGIPPKVYLDGTLKLEEVIISFGAEVEAVMPKLIAAIDRVQPPKPPPPPGAPTSPPPGWWDHLRFFIHGNLRACVGKLAFRWLLDSVQVPEWSILLQSRGGIELRYTLGRIILSSRTLVLSVPRQSHPLISEYAETNEGEEAEDISQQRHSLALIPRLNLNARLDWIVERPHEASPLEHHCPYLYYPSTPPEKMHDKFYRFRSHGVNVELDASVSGDARFANWFALRVDVLPWLMHRKQQTAPTDAHDREDECSTIDSSEIARLEQGRPKPPMLSIASMSVRATVTDLHAAIWYGPDETNGVCLIVPSAEIKRTSESFGGDEGGVGVVDRQANTAHTEIGLESVQAFLLDVNSNSADDVRSKRKQHGSDNNATTLSFVPSSKVDLNALDMDDRSTGIMGASPEEHVDILARKRRYANLASLYEYENQGDGRGIFFLLQVWSKRISDERYLVEAVSVVVTDRSMDDALLLGGGIEEEDDGADEAIFRDRQSYSSNEEKSAQGAGKSDSSRGSFAPSLSCEPRACHDDESASRPSVGAGGGENEPYHLVSDNQGGARGEASSTGKKSNQQQQKQPLPWTILVSGMKLLWTLEIRDAVVLLAEDLIATGELMKLQAKMNKTAAAACGGGESRDADNGLEEISPYDDSIEQHFGENEESTGFFSHNDHHAMNDETPSSVNAFGNNEQQPKSNLLKLLQQNSSVRRSSSKSNAHSEHSDRQRSQRQGSEQHDSFPIIQVRFSNPQIQLYSEATGGSIIMAMYGAYVEGLEFIRLFADYSGGGDGGGSVYEEFDGQGDQATRRNFPKILRKKQFKYTLDRVEVFALNSDVDVDAGLQWLKVVPPPPDDVPKERSGGGNQTDDGTSRETDHVGRSRGSGSTGKAGSLFNSRNFYHVPGQSLDSQERMMRSFDGLTVSGVTSASSFGDPVDILKEEEVATTSDENFIAAEKRAALPSLKELRTARDFEPPVLLRKIVDRFSFQTRQFMFRTPLDLSRGEIRDLLVRGSMLRVGGRFGTVSSIMDTIELRLDVLSFILDSYQFHTTIDVVRSVLLAPPPTSRRSASKVAGRSSDPEAPPHHARSGDDVGAKKMNLSFDTEAPPDENGSVSLLGASVNFDDDSSLSSCSTGNGLTSTDGDLTLNSSERRYTSPEEKLEKMLKKWHASRKRKRMRNALRVSVEELLDKLVDQRDEANGVRNIKWNLCKASWKIYTPEFLDDVEIELTGLRGQHEFSSLGSMVTELELEDLRVNSLKPAPDSMCFDDPTAVVTTSLGADRSPCDNCEVYFDRANNGKDSCRYHGDPYGNLGTFLESPQRWSCCGQTWKKAPGCLSSPHTGRERVALVRLDTLPRPVQGITLYNHVEVNIYPEVPHTIIVQMTKSVAILLKSYFIGDGASMRVAQAESAVASSTVGVISDDVMDTARSLPSDDGHFSQQVMFARDAVAKKKQTLLGKPPSSQGPKTSSPAKGDGRATKASNRNKESDENPGNKKDEEVIFIKRWCVGYVNTEISLAGFPIEAMRYGIKVPPFVRNYKIGPGTYLLRKYLSLLIHEVVKSVASSGFSKVKERIKGQTEEKQTLGTDRNVAENDPSELDEDAKKSLILGDHGITQARSRKTKIKNFLKKPKKKTR